jgi:hypothetical protein
MERAKKKASEYHGENPCLPPEAIERIAVPPKRATILRWLKRKLTKR